jgi:adenylate cyclase
MKLIYSAWAVALTIALLTYTKISDPVPIQSLRSQTFDTLQQLDEVKHSSEVVIVNIGERSLEAWGQWPWPRQNIAQLIADLRQSGAGIIALNVMFPETDRFGGDEVLRSWMNQNGIILSQTPSSKGIRSSGPHIGTATIGSSKPTQFLLQWSNLITNIHELEDVAAGIGVIASAPQPDNQTRTYPLAVTVGDAIYPSFVIEMLRAYTGKPSYVIKTTDIGVSEFAVPPFDPIVTNPDGTAYIRFNNTFDVLEYTPGVGLPDLGGKFVIVGVSAEGVSNPVPTPRGNILPQDIQAHMLQNFVDGSNIVRTELFPLIELVLTVLGMILIAIIVYKLPIWLSMPVSLGIMTSYAYGSVWAYTNNLWLIDATYPVLASFIIFSQASFNNFYVQFKLREQIKKQFEHYIAPGLVKRLQKNPELLKLGGETKTMTYLFSDIRGFTPISEQYKTDPQGLGKLINRYMTPMTNIALNNSGTIDKYIGDALMAIWGAPLDVPDHANQAVKTAQQMEVALAELNEELKKEGLLELGVGIGINTGDAVVGNMGSDTRFDYTVLGDSVNLAARLEGQTKDYGMFYMFTQQTLEHLTDYDSDELAFIDRIAVKGQTAPVDIYSLVSIEYALAINCVTHCYQNLSWSEARQNLKHLRKHNETLADLYEHRLNQPEPGPDWDGVDRKTSK